MSFPIALAALATHDKIVWIFLLEPIGLEVISHEFFSNSIQFIYCISSHHVHRASLSSQGRELQNSFVDKKVVCRSTDARLSHVLSAFIYAVRCLCG